MLKKLCYGQEARPKVLHFVFLAFVFIHIVGAIYSFNFLSWCLTARSREEEVFVVAVLRVAFIPCIAYTHWLDLSRDNLLPYGFGSCTCASRRACRFQHRFGSARPQGYNEPSTPLWGTHLWLGSK